MTTKEELTELKSKTPPLNPNIPPLNPRLNLTGVLLIKDFISDEEEEYLLSCIDKEEWNMKLARRTQHYGFIYDYSSKGASEETKPIPDWCKFIVDRLVSRKLVVKPDQMIVNEYQPGQGISSHVDDVRSFDDGIVSLTLGAESVMEFTHVKNRSAKGEVLLLRKSLLTLHDDARYNWRHGITARKFDYGKPRGRRVSLTFRKMLESKKKMKREEN